MEIKEGGVPELGRWDEQLIGHVMYKRAQVMPDDGREIPAMTLGPISICPDFQHAEESLCK